MLINSIWYTVLSIVVAVVITVGIGLLTHRRFGKSGITAAIVVGAFTWVAFKMSGTQVYVLEDCQHLIDCRMFGSLNYRLRNGEEINVPYDSQRVVVLNNTENTLVLAELVYTSYSFTHPEPQYQYVAPFACEVFGLPKMQIDYFFDESIPEEIEEYGSGNKSKYWIYCE